MGKKICGEKNSKKYGLKKAMKIPSFSMLANTIYKRKLNKIEKIKNEHGEYIDFIEGGHRK